jgi:hypothetical protein
MWTRLSAVVLLCLLAASGRAAEDEKPRFHGRVLDEEGRTVPGASVAAFWAANGLDWSQVVAAREKEPEKLWQNEGKMEPWGDQQAAGRLRATGGRGGICQG